MRNFNICCASWGTNTNLINKENSKKIRYPLCEEDILCLQREFLENGFHYFRAESIFRGRNIIIKLLKSLNYHKDIACLCLSTININNIFNVAQDIVSMENKMTLQEEMMSFFLNSFYFDFLWIEETNELKSKEWYGLFLENIINFNLHKLIPIVVICA